MDESLAIGVDLGATKIATALVTRSGAVLASREVPTDAKSGRENVLDRVAGEVLSLLRGAPSAVQGVGIGSPGLVDSATGVVRNAVNLGWEELSLATEIGRRINGLPVFVENDANAWAIGEGYFGSARGSQDYILLTVGSGLGSGVVSGGRLITGAHNMAADLGHWSLDLKNGRQCHCGRRGCAETIVSGPGLVAVARSLHIDDSATVLTPAMVVAAARQGDGLALQALSILAKALGQVAAMACAILDPEVVVIGGGLGMAIADLIGPELQPEMRRHLTVYQTLPTIRVATLASPAVGSACLVWSRCGTPSTARIVISSAASK